MDEHMPQRRQPRRSPFGRGRPALLAVSVAAALLVLGGVAYAIDSSHGDTIAKGVRVGGIDVGGMSTAKARATLSERLVPVVDQPVAASYAGRRFVLSAQEAGVRPDIDGSVQTALARGRGGWFVGRALDDVLGNSVKADVTPKVSYSVAAVDTYVTRVTGALDRKPQDATVEWSGTGPHVVRQRAGVTVDAAALRSAVTAAVEGAGSHHVSVVAS